MTKRSAGILLFRRKPSGPEVFLIHPGGPFWAKKDSWSIPKGEYHDGEPPLEAPAANSRKKPALRSRLTFLTIASSLSTSFTSLPEKKSRPGLSKATSTPQPWYPIPASLSGHRALAARSKSPKPIAARGSISPLPARRFSAARNLFSIACSPRSANLCSLR